MNCLRCNKLFPDRNGKKYCSKNCSKQASRKRKTIEKNHLNEIKECCICGKMFKPFGIRFKTCSDACTKTHKKKLREKWLKDHPEFVRKWHAERYQKIKNETIIEISLKNNAKQLKRDIESLNFVCDRLRKRLTPKTHKCRFCGKTYNDAEWCKKGGHKPCARIKARIWLDNRGRKINAVRHKIREQSDPEFLCKIRIRDRMHKAFKRRSIGLHIGGSKIRYLGCTYKQAFEYITSLLKRNMTWNNYGTHWHIDHVLPLASFDLNKESERYKAFHYSNLQPLEAVENMKKGSKIYGNHQPSLILLPPVVGPFGLEK